MTRPAHQDIDGLTETLAHRAEIEGLARGVRIGARRQIARWALRWGLGFAAAIGLAAVWDDLRWLPLLVAAFALVSLLSLFLVRARANRKIALARDNLDGLDGTLSELGRDPREDRL